MDTCQAKKAKQSHVGSKAGASSSLGTDDSASMRPQALEERLERMSESSRNLQASL